MLDELLEVFDDGRDGRGNGPAQRGGIRGLLSRIFVGEDGGDQRAPGQRACCSGQVFDDDDRDGGAARRIGCCAGDDDAGEGRRSHRASGPATRQRDQNQRHGDFDFGD